MIDFFIQSGLNIMILYMSSQSKYVCVSTSIGLSNLDGRGKISLLSNDVVNDR
jgi:hypothetical protein